MVLDGARSHQNASRMSWVESWGALAVQWDGGLDELDCSGMNRHTLFRRIDDAYSTTRRYD